MYSLASYDYDLPKDLIAQRPVSERDRSRLLLLDRRTRACSHHIFNHIHDLLSSTDVLVLNDTRVIPARLFGQKETGGKVEVLIIDYADGKYIKRENGNVFCRCLIKASKRPPKGSVLFLGEGFAAEVIDFEDSIFTVKLHCKEDFDTLLSRYGKMPLPPYIKRNGKTGEFRDDRTAYQTVYAANKGAVAAPTAGLHFSDMLLRKLKAKGVQIITITLHVGYGTFLPARAPDIRDHRMHSEWYHISSSAADTINRAKESGGRIVAVGTTSVRTLEYTTDPDGRIKEGSGDCDLFIYPGYQFKVVDAMLTNFHLPKSTLMMLVSAFAGRSAVLDAYKTAIEERYRFYSYGDAMFIV